MMVMVNRKTLAIICIMTAMFFNPVGFDIATKIVMDWTQSFETTMFIFYLVSAFFYGLFFLLSDINPLKWVRDSFLTIRDGFTSK